MGQKGGKLRQGWESSSLCYNRDKGGGMSKIKKMRVCDNIKMTPVILALKIDRSGIRRMQNNNKVGQ